jgi:hypothetical protein
MSRGDRPDACLHVASETVRAGAPEAFAFLGNGIALGRWALGCFGTRALGDDLFVGHSLFDGKALHVRIEKDPARLTVTYHVGTEPERLAPRVVSRVTPGDESGGAHCIVSLIAERTPEMTDERWRQLQKIHEAEILIVKALLEREPEGGRATPDEVHSPIR